MTSSQTNDYDVAKLVSADVMTRTCIGPVDVAGADVTPRTCIGPVNVAGDPVDGETVRRAQRSVDDRLHAAAVQIRSPARQNDQI